MIRETHSSFEIPDSNQKLKELILLIADNFHYVPLFGATKLNKILWMCDFAAYTALGRPITGVEYIKLQNGPAPKILLSVREELLTANDAVIKLESMGYDRQDQQRLIALRPPKPIFSAEELDIIGQVLRLTTHLSGNALSELSHGQAYHITEMGKPIPYEAAFLSDEPYTQADIDRSLELSGQHGW